MNKEKEEQQVTKKKSTNKWQMTLCFNAGDRKRSDDNSGKLKEEHASSEGAATLQLFAARKETQGSRLSSSGTPEPSVVTLGSKASSDMADYKVFPVQAVESHRKF
uniref:Uncharacterized protein n=1 Tax=Rangifer tarandus platyrhynchus TaxID=3082113 RepID=A0ACB0EFZ6_RANTA|nr:unnamed protein product [Rangifer tarandus platyrhynchus]